MIGVTTGYCTCGHGALVHVASCFVKGCRCKEFELRCAPCDDTTGRVSPADSVVDGVHMCGDCASFYTRQ